MRYQAMSLAVVGVASVVHAQGVLDGVAEKGYGPPIAVQNTQTQFGDSILGTIDYAGGSELDAIYAHVAGSMLHLVFTGNLESNFNKLEIFLDGVEGGQNQIRSDNPDVDFNGINRMGDDPATLKVVEGLLLTRRFRPICG